MPIDNETVLSFTRYNSGRYMLDSGGASGRHWQKPVCEELVTMDSDGECTISLHALLRDHADQVTEIQEMIDNAYEEDERGSIFFVPPEAMEEAGYVMVARDNTYNSENDLNQDFVFEVWQREDDDREWYYNEDAIVLVYCHTGADIRGGYAPAIAVRFDGEGTIPFCRVEFYCHDTGDSLESVYDVEASDVRPEDLTIVVDGDTYHAGFFPG